MGEEDNWNFAPTGSPPYTQRDEHWRHFDDSVNAISFGFIATAILISMFVLMAIFEKFLIPASTETPPPARRYGIGDVESQIGFNGKLICLPSPKIPLNAREVSVLMPGETTPTFIAHPAPVHAY
ncbi:UPF0753 protein like [Actinidia chinensis var. chinensis]|uniref:UPF0753 protein like n=1 Tax=Actinidia chinensis var. chinensis TaxID=1590841 RepID=A0A2R6QA34_ACTCC|nr:UPF0753 protein like [Actinidia chinensis var. chinensis]